MARLILAAAVVLFAAPSFAQDAPSAGEAWEVERVEPDEPKHPTMSFLTENRAFFRARLDELRLRLRDDWYGDARELDPRWLAWRDMLEEIRAARDSAAASEEWIRRRELLDSVGELVELELEMDEMDALLLAQENRLARLEEDFTGQQRTALIVLLKGVPSSGAPETVVLREADGPAQRIALSERVRSSLARGGSAELFHRLVEPRAFRWELSFEGAGWSADTPYEIRLEPERDRMTFLEIDASALDPARPGTPPVTRWWVR